MSDSVFGTEKTGSIRDIPLPGAKQSAPKELNLQSTSEDSQDLRGWNSMKGKNKKRGPKIIGFLILLVVLFFILSSVFHKAKITIDLKQESTPILQTFRATNIGQEGTVAFSRVSPFSLTDSLFIEGSIEENVQSKAAGKIVVKNTTNSQQRFIPNTRFENEDGLVYRTPRSVVIPAQGEVEITVQADIPGEEYNNESGFTFTLPGLRGTAGFNSFSAVQSGPLTGGYSGIITTPTDQELEAGKNTIEATLRDKLQAELVKRVPAGFVVTDDLLYISPVIFNEKPDQERGGIELVVESTIQAVMFKKTDFDTFIASSVLKDYTPGQSVSITNLPDITMELVSDDFDVQEDEEFEFSLRSPKEGALFVWNVNQDDVARAIAGKDVSSVERGLVPELSGAQNITVQITPPWKSQIPTSVKKIELQVTN